MVLGLGVAGLLPYCNLLLQIDYFTAEVSKM